MIDNAILRFAKNHEDCILRWRIINDYRGLARKIANSLYREYPEVTLDDLYQECDIILLYCIQNSRPKLNSFTFPGLVKITVRRKLLRFIFKNFRNVKRPENICYAQKIPYDLYLGMAAVEPFDLDNTF